MARKKPKDDDLHERFLRRFDTLVTPLQLERRLSLLDRRFVFLTGAQWEDEGWDTMSANMIRVEVNKTAIGLKRIQDDYRANRITVNYRSVRDTAEGTADLLDGLFRADVYRCKGQQAFDNAFLEGSAGGMGAFLVANELEDEYDPDDDRQRIRFDVIPDADQRVFFDDNSRLYDKSDAKDCFVLTAMAKDAYEDEYGLEGCYSWPEGLFKPIYDWYQPEIVIVAWYFRIEESDDTRRTFKNIATDEIEAYWSDEIDDEAVQTMLIEGWAEQPQKKRKRRRVAKYVMSGETFLEEKTYIAGSCLPVVPFYGQRSFIDNLERVQGHVRQAKDSQRIYNTVLSKLTETSAQSPIERPIVTPEQISGLEDHWADAAVNRSPYLPLNPQTNPDGSIAALGPIGSVSPPQLAPVDAAIIQIAGQDIEQLTGGGQNGEEVKSNVSAEAMDIAMTRLDMRDGSYMDNWRQTMQRAGEVYLSQAQDVYFEPGREVDTMDDDENQSVETLMEPAVTPTGRFVYKNDLSKGRFNVIADVTEATATRRDKTVKALYNIADIEAKAGDTAGSQAAIITMVENMDGEGMDDYKKWNRKRGLELGLFTPTDEEKAEMAQAAEAQSQPDPATIALLAQADDLAASAEKKRAEGMLTQEKIGEVQASIVQKYADAGLKAVQAEAGIADTAMKGRQTAAQIEQQSRAANEAA